MPAATRNGFNSGYLTTGGAEPAAVFGVAGNLAAHRNYWLSPQIYFRGLNLFYKVWNPGSLRYPQVASSDIQQCQVLIAVA